MQNPPQIYDPKALEARHRRVTAEGLFLHDIARDELQLRRKDVNRSFTKTAVITRFPDIFGPLGSECVHPAEVLDFADQDYDLIVHAMALHQSNDPLGQMIQSLRRLRPDGLFLAACFGGDTLADLRHALTTAELSLRDGAAPRVHPMIDIRDCGALMQRAGFALPVVDSISQEVSFADTQHLMRDLRAMGEGNALAQRDRRFWPKSMLTALERAYPKEGGRVFARFDLLFLAGWAPHESQQKPLRPGSATIALADALGTSKETPQN